MTNYYSFCRKEHTLESILERTTQVGNCLIWQGAKQVNGYGAVGYKRKTVRPHRLVYEMHTGKNIAGVVIHHTCANRLCLNIEHLQPASQAQNVLEMLARKEYEARIRQLESRVADLEKENAELRASGS
jgi:hypothetical protein